MSINPLNDISKVYLEQVIENNLLEKKDKDEKEKDVKRWWDDDGDGIGYEEGEVSGKFKKKKKKVAKEQFSNWREDLIEVVDKLDSKKKEKKVDNSSIIKINPEFKESIENIGGTILEMVEIDEVDFVVESVYGELLEEGYEEDDIEEALEYALTEATVTFGHDTPSSVEKKRGNLIKSVGRLARQKLSSKVRGAKKSAKAAVARGARKVAKGALGVARKMEGGDKVPKTAERKPSTYRGAGTGTKEKVSSGSYAPPTKKKAEKPSDPWKGSESVPQKKKPQQKVKPSDPWRGTATVPPKVKKTKIKTNLVAKEEVELNEKSVSTSQQQAAGAALAAKRGEISPSELKGSSIQMYKSMTEKQLRDFAKTKHKGLPQVKEQMDDSTEMSSTSPADTKKMDQQKKKIQMQKIKDLTVRLSAAKRGVY